MTKHTFSNLAALFSFSLLLTLPFGIGHAQNVGIGVNNPTMKLHVLTNVASDGIRLNNTAGNGDPI
ncbi:MAG: hypothetical protein AAF570_13760, partial [Bacteroidota bacterium]